MICYLGGKYRQASWINEFIKPEIKTYVEPFGGMFWAYLRNDRSFENVVYNDMNPFNANLFQCFKHHKEFFGFIKIFQSNIENRFYTFQKDLYHSNLQFRYSPDEPNFMIGFKYAYVLTHVFSGSNPESASFNRKTGAKPKFEILKSKLIDEKWKKRLNEITDIECLSYNEVISKYDSPLTHFYLDPPYFGTENYYSNHTFCNEQDHIELANYVKKIQGDFSLSYYDFPGMNDFYSSEEYTYNSREYTKSSGAKKGQKISSKGVEILITNNSPTNATETPVFNNNLSFTTQAEYNYLDNTQDLEFK